MSGYGGVDDHNANIDAVIQNGIDVVRASMPSGPSAEYCQDDLCGEPIPPARQKAVPGCQYCVDCAPKHAIKIRVRAVDHIL